ncbi:hypothetical protein [Nostoc favosum]|uniref:Uncharacterized protein n=1 Tax=Nostoc favosum CHAB5714 TaxID=2780399 RepID=A0ABS8II42_9NOSO|nr:hypothetical protein [Nostoc favosum]MCC5603882.1 hypothetical protein [Nostoc favosum CHAB5714]
MATAKGIREREAIAVKALLEQIVLFHKDEFTIYLRKVFILSQKQLCC